MNFFKADHIVFFLTFIRMLIATLLIFFTSCSGAVNESMAFSNPPTLIVKSKTVVSIVISLTRVNTPL